MTVHIRLLPTQDGMQIGVLALSAPERINAQNLAMVRQMHAALNAWQAQSDVVAVFVMGAGERGFCAGGDLKALHQAMNEPGQLINGDAFFAEEYALCAQIRQYSKPILAWGHGIVMGGGWGLFSAASHRVVTESSKLAMPETAIGLFPDVAASRWLPSLAGCGAFLALSGVAINAADALWSGAAQWALPDAARHELLQKMQTLPWANAASTHSLLADFLYDEAANCDMALPIGHLERNATRLRAIAELDLATAVSRCQSLRLSEDLWLIHATERVNKASPTSLWLAWTLQQRCRDASLAQTVALETRVSGACLRYGDFSAGIAATLFSRGIAPQWRVKVVADLDMGDLSTHFSMLFN